MTDQISVDAEYDLDIQSDLLLQSIEVGVEVEPPHANRHYSRLGERWSLEPSWNHR